MALCESSGALQSVIAKERCLVRDRDLSTTYKSEGAVICLRTLLLRFLLQTNYSALTFWQLPYQSIRKENSTVR